MTNKEELEKMVAMFKEQLNKSQNINKQRFDRIAELEEQLKIQGLQLALLFEVLRYDSKHKGFSQLVMMLGRIRKFWKRERPLNRIEQQIRDMEQKGLFNFEIEDDDDTGGLDDFKFPPFR